MPMTDPQKEALTRAHLALVSAIERVGREHELGVDIADAIAAIETVGALEARAELRTVPNAGELEPVAFRGDLAPASPKVDDPGNMYFVCAQGVDLAILRPPLAAQRMPAAAAANLAAWIVALLACQPKGGELFERTLEAVRRT